MSHNSGRDCDLAFFMRDEHGNVFVPPDLVEMDESGVWTRDDGKQFFFDAPRNWTLIEALLVHDQGALQYIFLSDGLKRLLLDHARKSGAQPELIRAADEIVTQPGGALPHNDHFHLRTYCSEDDIWGGCTDKGRITSRRRAPKVTRSAAIDWVETFLKHEDEAVREAAVVRLELLGASGSARKIEPLLSDASPQVRAAAARTLGSLGVGASAIARRLKLEEQPSVRLDLMLALSDVGGAVAVEGLAYLLTAPRTETELPVDEQTLAADALARLEDSRAVAPLVGALAEVTEPEVRQRILVALRKLTNHGLDDSHAAWKDWLKREGKKKRDAWLVAGFKAQGFKVEKLNPKFVWELCKAIHGPDFVSYNAQRALMRIAGKETPSLEWSTDDASFYWRRWFERRAARYGVPPIPPEMSTLKPVDTVSSR